MYILAVAGTGKLLAVLLACKSLLHYQKNSGATMSTITNHSLDSRLRESKLKSEVKLAETKSELIRWIVSVGLLQTALITALLIKLSAVV